MNPTAADFAEDTDGDGVSNVLEVDALLTDPESTSDFSALALDTDGDGLTDVKEGELGTPPAEPTSNTQIQAALSALGEAVFKQVAIMPLPLLVALAAIVGWLALRRRQLA